MNKDYTKFSDFLAGKAGILASDGRIGLFSNAPDMEYWKPLAERAWRKENEKISNF